MCLFFLLFLFLFVCFLFLFLFAFFFFFSQELRLMEAPGDCSEPDELNHERIQKGEKLAEWFVASGIRFTHLLVSLRKIQRGKCILGVLLLSAYLMQRSVVEFSRVTGSSSAQVAYLLSQCTCSVKDSQGTGS